MGRLVKILLITFFAIILLLAIAVFVITQVIDPNEFKPEIEKQAREQANLTLDIQGDLAWQFWPSLGVSLGRTEARIADEEELFAALDAARSAGVDDVTGTILGPLRFSGGALLLALGQRRPAPTWEEMATKVQGELRRRFLVELLPPDSVVTWLNQ